MTSEVKRKLYHSIVAFLATECSCSEYSNDTIEGLEVAKQCLESAFNVSGDHAPEADLLVMIQQSSQPAKRTPTAPEPTAEDKAMAEALKTQGNACMSEEKFNEAISCYTAAIEKDPSSAVYYCNRAAAYGRLNNYDESLKDCERAITIDPTYSKAYGRMGLAYSNKGNYAKAIEFYKKGLVQDPENTNFKQNLEIAEKHQRDAAVAGSDAGGILGGLDLNALLSNPMMQNMAQRFMTDPNLQSSMTSIMQGILGEGGGNPTATADATTTPNINSETAPNATSAQSHSMDNLLRMGQQFAQQMQQSNPDLVNTLRSQMQQVIPNPGQTPPSSDPPPRS